MIEDRSRDYMNARRVAKVSPVLSVPADVCIASKPLPQWHTDLLTGIVTFHEENGAGIQRLLWQRGFCFV